MLGINMADVINVLMSVLPQLIVIGVVLVLAIIVTVAVNKKTVADTATRKLIHSESWLVFLVAAVVSVSMMLFGPLATLLNSATATKYTLSEETISNASDLAKEIQSRPLRCCRTPMTTCRWPIRTSTSSAGRRPTRSTVAPVRAR